MSKNPPRRLLALPVNNVMCGQIREAGMEPGYIGMQLTAVLFAAVFNLAKTGWFTTDAVSWERDFLAGKATAAGAWEGTMDYVRKYIDIGMFNPDPEDHSGCIARMDELQSDYLNNQDAVYFCESTADFTLEETARLVGKAFGSAVGADAVLIATNDDNSRPELRAGLTGKRYKGPVNSEAATTITFGSTREYAVMTMTGAQVKELAETGFDAAGDGETYRVAFAANSYTEEAGQTYNVQVEEGALSTFVRSWLEKQGTVYPDGNPWE